MRKFVSCSVGELGAGYAMPHLTIMMIIINMISNRILPAAMGNGRENCFPIKSILIFAPGTQQPVHSDGRIVMQALTVAALAINLWRRAGCRFSPKPPGSNAVAFRA